MTIFRILGTLTLFMFLLDSEAPLVNAAITDVDIVNQAGTNAGGSASGHYEDEFFCFCNNPETAAQANWTLNFGATVTGGAMVNFTHTLTSTVNHNGNGANTVKVKSKHGIGLRPRMMSRKNSIAHGTSWDNQIATVTPVNSGNGKFTSKWDHSSKKLAYNMTGPGSAGEAVLVEYAPEAGILVLATSGLMTIGSESELFAGSYQVEFDVVINLVDDKIDSIASSWINVFGPNGFELLNGELNFISDVPAGDPYGDVFGELGSETVGGSIADTRGMTFEITPGSFDNMFTEDISLDALTLAFENALDLGEGLPVEGDSILFGAQFSVENADFDQDSDVDGADYLILQRGLGTTFDAVDMDNWSANYGNGPSLAATAVTGVPEPSSVILLMLGIMALQFRTGSSSWKCHSKASFKTSSS